MPSVKSSQALDAKSRNTIFFPGQPISAEPLGDRFELVNSLQQSLDVNEQLQTFMHWVQKRIDFSGLHYRCAAKNVRIDLGEIALHSVEYRLITPTDNLGEISFTRGNPFGESELATLETFLSALLFPLRNGLQYLSAIHAAMTDNLTCLGNRVALDNALHRELKMAERHQQALSLLVIDIDFFKKINDSFGHSCGDAVLKQVADAIGEVTRQEDTTFRYGGEEFVMVLSNTSNLEACRIAERVRDAIARTTFNYGENKIAVTVSVGVSTLRGQDKRGELFSRADQALYSAKKTGRNRVVAIA